MNLINPREFKLEMLYVSSILENERCRFDDSDNISKSEQKQIFENYCEALQQTWNTNPEACILVLKSINKHIKSYGICQTLYSEQIAKIIIELLKCDNIQIVKDALVTVSNTFSNECKNQIQTILLNYNIIDIVHELFGKWGTSIFTAIIFTISNMEAISKMCRDKILQIFKPIELEVLISSTVIHESCKNRCKIFLKKLCYYELNCEIALEVFELLVNLKKYTGNWIFEPMGLCTRWINKNIIINQSLIEEAFVVLLSNEYDDIRSALIFIRYTTPEINERIIQLLADEREEISALAIWSVINFIRFKGPEGVQISLSFNILQIIQNAFCKGCYKQRIESAFCLCNIIKYSTVTEINHIISLGLFTKLAEIFENCTNQELSISIMNIFIKVLKLYRNEETIAEITRLFDENDLYDIVVEEENSNNIELSQVAGKLLDILDKI